MMQAMGQQRRWLILACIPRVVPDGEASPPGTDFSFQFKPPPRASCLTVPRRIAPDPKDIENHPYVAAVSNHGRFLLYATQGNGYPGPGEPRFVDRFHEEPLGVHRGYPKAYILCDLITRAATRIPDPGPYSPNLHPGNVALLTGVTHVNNPGGHVVSAVVELQHMVGSDLATLIWYDTSSNRWRGRHVNYPRPAHRPWGSHGVISPAEVPGSDRLTWVDLSCGLLTSHAQNLFNEIRGPEPPLRFIPLPAGCERSVGTVDLDKERCVGMSGGSLRYVQIHRRGGEHFVSKWTLDDWATGSWHHDGDMSFSVIWDDAGYRAMKLLPEVPAVAFIGPHHGGDAVYFLLHSQLFGVDVRTGKFLQWDHFVMNHPPSRYHSSRFVRVWNMTPDILNHAIDSLRADTVGGYPRAGAEVVHQVALGHHETHASTGKRRLEAPEEHQSESSKRGRK